MREASTDDGSPREPSPFWHEVAALRARGRRARDAPARASELTWPLEAAPTERERLRALARLSADPDAPTAALALADGERLVAASPPRSSAFDRETRAPQPARLAQFGGRTMFGATELERFVDCSSAWLFERVVDPKTIDAEADADAARKGRPPGALRLLLGAAEGARCRARHAGEPRAGASVLARCLDDALGRRRPASISSDVEAAELREGLRRDLERFCATRPIRRLALLPRRFEVGFGTDRSAPELQRGIELGDGLFVSGKIDRIDVDPFSARGIVQDYKSGKGSFSARRSMTSGGSRCRSTCSCCAISSGSSRSAASTGRCPAPARRGDASRRGA